MGDGVGLATGQGNPIAAQAMDNKDKQDFLVAVKPNIMMAYSREDPTTITDPELVERLIDKATRAGCSNVFIGMESINPANLKDAGKRQNKVDEYRDLIEAWHRVKVSTHGWRGTRLR